ncbi:hypothetical protein [Clostridium peptidivorans]|uniref:hypothetical protein n=1 Tax=Clostridium peptidivorans TaxID=100174 RepID=UPI00311A4DC8
MRKGYGNMLKLYWIEIFLRGIPEILLMIWGIYVIAKTSINMKNYIFSSIIMVIVTFLVRMLPIYMGVHTFIIIFFTIGIMVIAGIPIIKAIYSVLLMFLILSLSEFLNMVILNLLNIDINIEVVNPITKSMLGIPSLTIACLLIITIRYFIASKEEINIFEDKNY